MNTEQKIMSDYIVFNKYAKYSPIAERRETWSEVVARRKQMDLDRFPALKDEINKAYEYVERREILPSMRSMQFGGKPIAINPSRIYNCSYLPMEDVDAFSEIMFLLLGGTGVGYSVQYHHVEKLPTIQKPLKTRRFLIGDSIEGWADAVKALMRAYLDPTKKTRPDFDFSDIRDKGEPLITSGGKAPGPEPLRTCLFLIQQKLERKENGERLTPIEVHDIVCHIADAVLAGGIRRAALISLFSFDDEALRPYQFCNLCEINATIVKDQAHFEELVKAATFIGTLQASYTDFHYLRNIWKDTTEKDALVGVGITGIASNALEELDKTKAAEVAKEENTRVAELIGINAAARVTTIKPSGTSSLVVGSSSGIHAYHNDYYIRGVQINKNEAVWSYLEKELPDLVEDYEAIPNTGFFKVPMKAPEGAQIRTESTETLLDRVRRYNTEWVANGHRNGMNRNNVSATISIREGEWDMVRDWMWEYRDTFNGLSVLPYDGGTYTQAPFTDCTKEEYEELKSHLHKLDLRKVKEDNDFTDHGQTLACGPTGCEII